MTESLHQAPRLKYYTLVGFFVVGVVTVLLGQVLPVLSARLALNDAQAGTFFLAQFSGSMLGTLISTRIARQRGFVATTLIGLVMMVVGLPGLNFSAFILCWLSIFVYGIGLGLTIPAINLLTIESTPPDRQSSAINLINFSWGAGAICSQPFVELMSRDLIAVSVILDIALVALAVCFFWLQRMVSDLPVADNTPVQPMPRIWKRSASWLFIVFAFFNIGIETGLGGWLTSYSDALKQIGHGGINLAFVFFAFLVLGRGLASMISRRLSENVLISICAITLLTGISLLVTSETLAIAGAAIAGLGTSAIFPTNMVRFTRIFGPDATRQAAPLFIAGIMGAATLSWLIGLVSTEFGSLRIGIVVLMIAAVIVLVLQVVIVTRFTSPD